MSSPPAFWLTCPPRVTPSPDLTKDIAAPGRQGATVGCYLMGLSQAGPSSQCASSARQGLQARLPQDGAWTLGLQKTLRHHHIF